MKHRTRKLVVLLLMPIGLPVAIIGIIYAMLEGFFKLGYGWAKK